MIEILFTFLNILCFTHYPSNSISRKPPASYRFTILDFFYYGISKLIPLHVFLWWFKSNFFSFADFFLFLLEVLMNSSLNWFFLDWFPLLPSTSNVLHFTRFFDAPRFTLAVNLCPIIFVINLDFGVLLFYLDINLFYPLLLHTRMLWNFA